MLNIAAKLSLDEEKIAADSLYDGLKAIITNDKDLSSTQLLSHYHNLYVVEDAFRITKHDLAVRPVFCWKPSRISTHIAICFCAYSLVKHLQYRQCFSFFWQVSLSSIYRYIKPGCF